MRRLLRTFSQLSYAPRYIHSCLWSPFRKNSFQFVYFQIKIMKALEDDADYKLKTLKENDLDNKDIEEIKVRLKTFETSGWSWIFDWNNLSSSAKIYSFSVEAEGQALWRRVCSRVWGWHQKDGAVHQGKDFGWHQDIGLDGNIRKDETMRMQMEIQMSWGLREWLTVAKGGIWEGNCSQFCSQAMEREITKRRQVIELLGQGKKYYDRWAAKIQEKNRITWNLSAIALEGHQPFFKYSIFVNIIPILTNLKIIFHIFSLYGEAEIVATAYSNFGQRVKKVSNWILTFSVLRDRNPLWHVHECSRVITYCVTGSSEAKGKKCWVK